MLHCLAFCDADGNSDDESSVDECEDSGGEDAFDYQLSVLPAHFLGSYITRLPGGRDPNETTRNSDSDDHDGGKINTMVSSIALGNNIQQSLQQTPNLDFYSLARSHG